MNENLNLVEILKDVPVGTELYSSLFGIVTFEKIDLSCKPHPVIVKDSEENLWGFASDGKYYSEKDGECLLFPSKENRDWSTFLWFKPGDFVYRTLTFGLSKSRPWISIHKGIVNGNIESFVNFSCQSEALYYDSVLWSSTLCTVKEVNSQRKATPEEKQLLIQAMLQQGYIFDEETCTPVKLQPGTFIIVETGSSTWYSIFKEIKEGIIFSYMDMDSHLNLWSVENGLCRLESVKNIWLATPEEVDLCMKRLNEQKLVWNKDLLSLTKVYEDEAKFKPFQEVLVRNKEDLPWKIEFFSHILPDGYYRYCCLKEPYKYCIPLKGNEDKLGKV